MCVLTIQGICCGAALFTHVCTYQKIARASMNNQHISTRHTIALLSNQHNRDFKMSNGFGTITWWGFSPAIDLQNPGNLYRYDLTTCESNIENNH